MEEQQAEHVVKSSPPQAPPLSTSRHNGPYTLIQRKEAIEAFQKSNMSLEDFARLWGVGCVSLAKWWERFEKEGPKGLEARKPGPRGRPRRPGIREEITKIKQKFPDFGLRKVRDFLARFHGVKVSVGSVRNALEEKGLNTTRRYRRREKVQPPRRFERACAGDLWQSDITSFVLTRHKERVYLTVFLDDYSRYIVSWGLYLHQKQDIVTETLLDGIQRFGKPKEVLTDQGRQYFAWRGKGDFQKLLRREGIQHVVARTHHPQTVGKTERFWATVGEEFWERFQPQDFTEAKERFGHFVAHYNHFRPHQGIDGMVPADRFFGVESQVRETLEKAMARNELHLALWQAPRKPVFLVGQIGDQQVSMHGERGRLIFQTQEGNIQEMDMEGLGAPGGKDGNGKSGRDSIRTAEETKDAHQEPEIQDTKARAQTDEVVVGFGDGGRKAEGPQGGSRHPGDLVGTSYPAGDRREAGGAATESVADVPAGAGGAGGGSLEAAQGQEGIGKTQSSSGGGSGQVEQTNSLAGKGLGNDEGVGGAVERISSQSGAENES